MKLIGLLLNLAVITATILAEPNTSLTLRPSDQTVVRYTNESLIVQCHSPSADVQLQWKSPKGEIIKEHKGRIHIEQTPPEQLQIVFAHISLADKGNWTCEAVDGGVQSQYFDLIVYQKITFTENATILTVKEGRNATILCEVKGEPQPNVTWNFNGQPITIDTNTSKFRILADGLLINKVTQNDTGEYTCRAYQVNPIASDMQERTVLMKIEHKPFWTHKKHTSNQYVYPNGTTTITCEAIAEPPANFTWYREDNKKHLHNDKYYNIESDNYVSTLTIKAIDNSVFHNYKCRAQNSLGRIERITQLEKGEKPPAPTELQLRGFNSNKLIVNIVSERTTPVMPLMDIEEYSIEYMSELEFKQDAGKWTNAKRKDFRYKDVVGATFMIGDLEANTTYFMRAASKNLAGYSDWTRVEKFSTISNEPPSASAQLEHLTLTQLLCISLTALFMCKELSFGFQTVSSIILFKRQMFLKL